MTCLGGWRPNDGHRHERDRFDATRCWKCCKPMRPMASRGTVKIRPR